MNFFPFLNLIMKLFVNMLSVDIISESGYRVTLGGFLLGLFLISVVFRMLFSFSGFGGGISLSGAVAKANRKKSSGGGSSNANTYG